MKRYKSLELEWKLLFVAGLVFAAFYLPLQNLFERRIESTILESSDPVLETYLIEQIESSNGEKRDRAVEILERQRQWKATAPLVIREQNGQFRLVALTLLGTLLAVAFFSFRRLSRPLRELARAVEQIGRGESAEISAGSGGSLGVLESKVRDLQEELAVLRRESQVQGMERAWRDIARVMAHEIKNPLTPMRLTVDRIDEKLAMDQTVQPQELKRFTDRMNRQLDTLETLVNRFRSFSREPQAHIELIDPRGVIDEIAGDMAGVITTTISGDAMIRADRVLIRQVLLNIFKNSAAANASAMNVTIAEDHDVTISLNDNGSGIDADQISTIFLPYVTFSEGGSGIGLSVVKNCMNAMNGTVTASSEKGKGFTIELHFHSPEQNEKQKETA